MQGVKSGINPWNWVRVLPGDVVKLPVVHTKASRPIFLLDQYDWRHPWTCRRLDYSSFEHLVEQLLDLLAFVWGDAADSLANRGGISCRDMVF